MSTTDASPAGTTELPGPNPLDMRVEVVVVPVSDIDRSRRFYEQLGWRFDTELVTDDGIRLIQFTPPESLGSVSSAPGARRPSRVGLERGPRRPRRRGLARGARRSRASGRTRCAGRPRRG